MGRSARSAPSKAARGRVQRARRYLDNDLERELRRLDRSVRRQPPEPGRRLAFGKRGRRGLPRRRCSGLGGRPARLRCGTSLATRFAGLRSRAGKPRHDLIGARICRRGPLGSVERLLAADAPARLIRVHPASSGCSRDLNACAVYCSAVNVELDASTISPTASRSITTGSRPERSLLQELFV
jgi:hypothetical protein